MALSVAAVTWKVHADLRLPEESDVDALRAATRAARAPDIVIVALHGTVSSVPTTWKAFLCKFLVSPSSETIERYSEVATVERGGSYLTIYALQKAVPRHTVIGSFEVENHSNTTAMLHYDNYKVLVANWAFPGGVSTSRQAERVAMSYKCLEESYKACWGGEAPNTTRAYTGDSEKSRRWGAALRDAESSDGMLERGGGALGVADVVVLLGGFESRQVDGRDQLAVSMKNGHLLPCFVDTDSQAANITSFFDPGDLAHCAAPLSTRPKGRAARILYHTHTPEVDARSLSSRSVLLNHVLYRPIAALMDFTIRPLPSDKVTGRVAACVAALKEAHDTFRHHTAKEEERLAEEGLQAEDVDNAYDSDDYARGGAQQVVPPGWVALGGLQQSTPDQTPEEIQLSVGSREPRSEDKSPFKNELLAKYMAASPEVPPELFFEQYYPDTPRDDDTQRGQSPYVNAAGLVPSQPKGLPKGSHDTPEGSEVSYPADSVNGSMTTSKAMKGAYSPTYYLPPWFTLMWSVTREAYAAGEIHTQNIEQVALATLYSEEYHDMLHERGRLMDKTKQNIRERELTRREHEELAELRDKPLITRNAHNLPSRGEFYSYGEEWKRRNEIERDAKLMTQQKEQEELLRASKASMSASSHKIIERSGNAYKSPIADWHHHAIEHFAKRHQHQPPGGVFEPVLNPQSYKLGAKERPSIYDRTMKAKETADRKVERKRRDKKEEEEKLLKKVQRDPAAKDVVDKMMAVQKDREAKFMRKKRGLLLEECPAKPILNPRSMDIVNRRPRVSVSKTRSVSRSVSVEVPGPKKIVRTQEEILEKAKKMSDIETIKKARARTTKKVNAGREEPDYSFKPCISEHSRALAAAREASFKPDDLPQQSEEFIIEDPPSYAKHSTASKTNDSVKPSVRSRSRSADKMTTGELLSRPRAGNTLGYTVSPVHDSMSRSPQFFTPLNSSNGTPWLVPQERVYPSQSSTNSTHVQLQQQHTMQNLPSYPSHHSRVTPQPRPPPTTPHQDPYDAIEQHLSTMCSVLDEYRNLEDYASSIVDGV